MSEGARVGLVIPTLFRRDDYLLECIKSARASGNVHILLMGPRVENSKKFASLADQFMEEPPLPGLSAKLNVALGALPLELEFITWLGDDDLLEPQSMNLALAALEGDPDISFVYGGCKYIDATGKLIGTNRSGKWAVALMKFGPFLIPQPGSVFRRSHFKEIGELNPDLALAFDFDLVARLKQIGKIHFLGQVQASYRWHEEALSVGQRKRSALEAAKVRAAHAKGPAKLIVIAINPFVAFVTLAAGRFVGLHQYHRKH